MKSMERKRLNRLKVVLAEKNMTNKRLAELVGKDPAMVSKWVTNVAQPNVEITEVLPEPILMNYQNNLIHQITKSRNNTPKSVFKQTFVLPVFEVHANVNAAKIGNYKDTEKNLLIMQYCRIILISMEN